MSNQRLNGLFSQMKIDQDALADQPIPGLAERCMDEAWGPAVDLPISLTASTSSQHRLRWLLLPVTASCVFLAGYLWATRTRPAILEGTMGGDATAIEAGKDISATASDTLPLRFTDGSIVTMQPMATAEITQFTASGAEVVLKNGDLLADIVHAPNTHWQVIAGPFRVLVTGTRFLASYHPNLQSLEVHLYQGGVLVQGPMLGNGIPLVAGQKIEVGIGQAVVVRPIHQPLAKQLALSTTAPLAHPSSHSDSHASTLPLTESAEPVKTTSPTLLPPTATAAPQGPSKRALPSLPANVPSTHDWASLADNGQYEKALAAAQEIGFSKLCRHLPARRLITLADVARFAGDPTLTQKAFESLVERFPKERYAADALFGLGRLSSETGNPRQAVRWFERYLRDFPSDAFGEQAAGRLLELYQTIGDDSNAVESAKSYLEKYPSGMRASHARRLLSAHGVEADD